MILIYYFIFGIISDCDIVIKMAQKLGLNHQQPRMYANIQIDCCLPYEMTGIWCSDGHVKYIFWDSLGLDGDVTNLEYPPNVAEFYLDNNNLKGSLNFKLPSDVFVIDHNRLSGIFNATVPVTLDRLSFTDNQLEGILDFDFHGSDLGVSKNKFTGNLPRMNAITYLACQMNLFNGTLTNKLPNTLQYGSFESNQFIGEIGAFPTQARSISMHHNLLNGTLPAFPSLLNSFIASNNLFIGNIPFLKNLKTLKLDNNHLNGIFEPITTNLLELTIKNNTLTGNMSNWVSAESIQKLDISDNHFYGEIRILKNNCYVNITSNNITSVKLIDGSCSAGGIDNYCSIKNNPISNFTSLPLNCESNHVFKSGYGCEQLIMLAISMKIDLINPEYFDSLNQDCCLSANIHCSQGSVDKIQWNSINTLGFEITLDMDLLPKGLASLSLSNNNLVKMIGQVPQSLNFIEISYNKINGTLPDCANLRTILIDHNQFSGQITQKVINALQFYINGNNFNGTMPEAPNAKYYYANDNQFSGAIYIPPNTDQLFVQNNKLSGNLPGFGKISYGNMNHNQLSGTIPLIPNGMINLDLSFNQFTNLTGPFPTSLEHLFLQSNKINTILPTLPPNMITLVLGLPNQLDSNNFSGNVTMLELNSDKFLYLYNNSISNVYIAAPNTLKYCDITKNPNLNATNLENCANNSDSFLKQNLILSESSISSFVNTDTLPATTTTISLSDQIELNSYSTDESKRIFYLFRVYFDQKSIFQDYFRCSISLGFH
eukprot:NODE_45_length_32908_cov_0.790271.p2 type:complete len:770 gc:universal NODE_45_length_32908_cov_0.790271:14956-17265(+)